MAEDLDLTKETNANLNSFKYIKDNFYCNVEVQTFDPSTRDKDYTLR